jgi:hypothetical protein
VDVPGAARRGTLTPLAPFGGGGRLPPVRHAVRERDDTGETTAPGSLAPFPGVELDERAARATLRAQIARLEREHAGALADCRPGEGPGPASVALRGPRLLSLGELECTRDDLADRLHTVRAQIAQRADREADRRRLLERMLLAPGDHRWVRITQAELGEPGCGAYHVRPRLGIVGMLAGWWQVKVSSGCPLAGGRASARPRPVSR